MRLASFFGGARRAALLGLLSTLAVAALASFSSSAFAAEEFGVAKFESGTCTEAECIYESEPSVFYTQSTGHPPYGITDFTFNTEEPIPGFQRPIGNVKNIRIDLPLGFSVNPEAVPHCSQAEFGVELEEGAYSAPTCSPETRVGTNFVTIAGVGTLEGAAYDLEQPSGVPTEIGVAIDISPLLGLPAGTIYAHTILEGGVSWHSGETYASGEAVPNSGNYHEYFKINDVPTTLPLVRSRLVFEGQAGSGFLTMPSMCGPAQTTLWVESYEGETETTTTTPAETPTNPSHVVPVSGCGKVPFQPDVNVKPATTPTGVANTADAADGATVEVLVPQSADKEAIDSSTVKQAEVTLPAGMTFNPAAAVGLEACSNKQFHKGEAAAIECPAASRIGTATIETPTLPAGSLTGGVYVGQPEAGATPASGNEYRIFVNAESQRYGVTIRLEGKVKANEATGQLTTLVAENPPLPFSDFKLALSEGQHTPLANPITCGAQSTTGTFLPYSAPTTTTAAKLIEPFTVTNCAAFAPTQATAISSPKAGGETNFTFTLTRPEGQPYVSTLSTTLPPGLVGKIPSVPLCEGAAIASGACPAASSIGTAAVQLGSGSPTLPLSGTVYLTGPSNGSGSCSPGTSGCAPYGLTIVVPATSVGPYDYGNIVTTAKIEVNPTTSQVTVSSQLPVVIGGAQIRLRSLTVAVTHPKFMINPTNCAALQTVSAVESTLKDKATATSPFQVTGCSSLQFEPSFKAGSSGKTSRKEGASLKTTLKLPAGGANVRSVSVTLPKQLPSRQSTLKQACLLATFEANPESCPTGSQVGTASAVTPVLPAKLKGKAYYVSLGHAGFPNLDVVLKGDNVTIVLVGNTEIKKGITHTKFLTLPDVPVSRFTLNLPMGEKSALSAPSGLCRKGLYMPTSIVGQNGAIFSQKTKINVSGCPILITKHRVKGRTVRLRLRAPSAGKILVRGKGLVHKTKVVSKGKTATVTERLTAAAARRLAARHRLKVTVRVKFKPKKGSASKASLKVKLKG